MSGTLGEDDVPGPTSYWIDAFCNLSKASVAHLADEYPLEPTPLATDLANEIAALVPGESALSSPALDRATAPYGAQVWIYPLAAVAVIRARFQ